MTGWARRVLPWVPAVLLATVASAHGVLVVRHDLSRWLGGGFGMFSTTDSSTSRHVHAYTTEGARRTPVELPEGLDELVRHTRVFPTAAAVQRLASTVAGLPDIKGRPVEVEVWQTTYDTTTMAPSSHVLRTAVAEGDLRDPP